MNTAEIKHHGKRAARVAGRSLRHGARLTAVGLSRTGRATKTGLRKLIARQLEGRVKRLLREQDVKVVGVTGSVGKTGTKLAIAEVLRQKYKVLAHPGNFNSEIGLPLAIFEIDIPETLINPVAWAQIMWQIDKRLEGKFGYDVMVLEMGADQPGDIKKFMSYIQPDIGIVTAIAPAHVEGFGSVDAIAKEKMSLAHGSRAVLLNAEDERVMSEAQALHQPVQTYGVATGGVHWEGVTRSKEFTLHGRLQLNNGEIAVKTRLVGRHNLSALAAAGAVGEELGLEPEQIRAGLESIEPVSGRMQVLEGINDSIVLDDTYNSSPRSVTAALETLAELPGRKLVVLGSMNELGELSAREHRSVGVTVASMKPAMLVTIGMEANRYIPAGAVEHGFARELIHTFDSPYNAGEFLRSMVKAGDVVLVKGSQNGVFAEETVAMILANPSDRSRLVRQSSVWQRRKRAQFEVE
jgi:UDP-N-acetylmuramoyl-tripeptide--D-alanyl-D-alanine ligase